MARRHPLGLACAVHDLFCLFPSLPRSALSLSHAPSCNGYLSPRVTGVSRRYILLVTAQISVSLSSSMRS